MKNRKTVISTLFAYIEAQRRAGRLSRESTAQEIVSAHRDIGADVVTGITFSDHEDAYTRQRVNSDRIFRWLDEVTKDTNLLPVNFLPSILASLPIEARLCCVNEILQPLGMVARPMVSGPENLDATEMLRSVLKEGGEAEMTIAALLDGATPDELAAAQKELSESIETQQKALEAVEAELLRLRGAS